MKQLLLVTLLLMAFVSYGQNKKAGELYLAGYKMIDNRNYSAAIGNFLEALKIDSTGNCGTGINGKTQGELGFAYLRVGDTSNAIKYLDESIRLDSTNAFPIQNKAALLAMQKKVEEACKLLSALIEHNPNFINAYIQRGFLYEYDKKHELAVKDFQKALELNRKTNILPSNLVSNINAIIEGKKDK